MTPRLLKSSGLFVVFWSISTMQKFGWFPLVLEFSGSPNPVPILWSVYQVCQSRLVSSSFSYSIVVFSSQARSRYLCFFSFSFSFTLWSAGRANSSIRQGFLSITRFGRLAKIKWSVCTWKSQKNLSVSFSRIDSMLCIYHLLVWSNLNFLHNSLWIPFSTNLCLVLYSFGANLLHSLIMWLIVSSLSPQILSLLSSWLL